MKSKADGHRELQQLLEWMMDGSYKGQGQQHNLYSSYQVGQDLLQQQNTTYTSPGVSVLAPSSSNFLESYSGIGLVSSKAITRNLNSRQSPTIAYRPMRPTDFEVLRKIHENLFPIKYEAEFFLNVVNGHGILSLAAVDTSRTGLQCDEIIGFVTARVVSTSEIDAADMLGYDIQKAERSLIYILTLGVITAYRNLGIASSLIWEVLEYASRISTCRAVYLHVISYNQSAINFYKKNSFQCLQKLHNFYFINGHHYDAYLYIYYVNGGRSPCLAVDFLMAMTSYLRSILTSTLGRLFWTREVKKAVRWPKSKEVGGLLSPGCCFHGAMDDSACPCV